MKTLLAYNSHSVNLVIEDDKQLYGFTINAEVIVDVRCYSSGAAEINEVKLNGFDVLDKNGMPVYDDVIQAKACEIARQHVRDNADDIASKYL